ncbi:MAG: ACP S-malonyltransferase [Anaerolineales bacterium]
MPLHPETTAFLFPGQGSQAVGMGASLAEAEPEAARIFERADAILGYPLSEICFHGPVERLNDTLYTQPALLTHSVAVLETLKKYHPALSQPACAAGHSLGEFAALVAVAALDFDEGLRLVSARARGMQQAGEAHPGGMSAVLGLTAEQVEAACAAATNDVTGGVWVANDNCPGQIVISGDDDALELAAEYLREAGARRVLRLAVSIAAHSPLMQPAQARFGPALDAAEIKKPGKPVVGNVRAHEMNEVDQIRSDLKAQLTSRVRWTESIQSMIAAGVETFIEMGPGNVLTGLLRRIDSRALGYNLDDPASFEKLPL